MPRKLYAGFICDGCEEEKGKDVKPYKCRTGLSIFPRMKQTASTAQENWYCSRKCYYAHEERMEEERKQREKERKRARELEERRKVEKMRITLLKACEYLNMRKTVLEVRKKKGDFKSILEELLDILDDYIHEASDEYFGYDDY